MKPVDLVQGTLDLLILKSLALEPMHGWAIAARIRQLSNDVLLVQQGSLIRRCSGWSTRAGSVRNGASPTRSGAPSTTR